MFPKLLPLLALLLGSATFGAAGDKPNVLFIMSDDHTWQAVGAYNTRLSYLNPTPTLDKLAAEGMIFDNAFCTNSICTPSRASIMTGQYSHVNGSLTLNGRIDNNQQYLAHEMKGAGYQTAVIGKWHLKARPSAFDYYKVLPGQGKYFNPTFYESGSEEPVQMTGHSTDRVTDSALEWFKEKRDPDRPFFLKLHYKAPHDYFEYAPRYEDYLADVTIPEPLSLWERGEGSIATRGTDGELDHVIATSIGRRNYRRSYDKDFEVYTAMDDTAAKREAYNIYLKKYLRCVKGVDDNLARVFAYLEAEGLMDNTVIVYTGDQGFFLGEHDMQDKRWAYEPSYRMPLIVRYPKTIAAGSRSDAIVENVDYPVTMLDYAGVTRPDYMQGASFRPILDTGHESTEWKKGAYYQYWMHMAHHDVPGHIALRTKRYKLILFHGAGGDPEWSDRSAQRTPPAWELYDLQNDPHETDNLVDDPAYAGVLQGLKAQLKELRADIRADDASTLPAGPNRDRAQLVNNVIDEYWHDTPANRRNAAKLSTAYLQSHGADDPLYIPPWLRLDDLDPSEK